VDALKARIGKQAFSNSEGVIRDNKHELIILLDSAMLELQLSSQSRVEYVDVINRTDTTARSPINATDWNMHFDMPQAGWNEPLESASETVVQAGWQITVYSHSYNRHSYNLEKLQMRL
jgi:hypothetical protein